MASAGRVSPLSIDLVWPAHRVADTRVREPVTVGLPLPQGLCPSPHHLRLVDDRQDSVPLQAKVMESWPDGSVRWVLLDFQMSSPRSAGVRLEVGSEPRSLPTTCQVTTTVTTDGIDVDTGAARFLVRAGRSGWFADVRVDGRTVIDTVRSGLTAVMADGTELTPIVSTVRCEETGALRTVVLADGHLAASERSVLTFRLRLHFFAGLPSVRHQLTILNPRRAQHRDGFWELGDPGSVHLRELSVVMGVDHDVVTNITCWPGIGQPPIATQSRFELFQDSSGCPNWQSSNHVAADGATSVRFQGYEVRTAGETTRDLHATPSLSLRQGHSTLAVAMPQFWENFPKSIVADASGITLGLFPSGTRAPHELQGGEQKTHVFDVAFDEDPVSTIPLDWSRQPARISAEPHWYSSAQAVRYLVPAAEDPNRDYLGLVQRAIEGPQSFAEKRIAIDEYGWRNFGELYGDHEAVARPGGAPPLVSHYNNQYDGIAGAAIHFLRTADWRWWSMMDELAAHVVDIDIYHTQEDKAAYNNGLFWHTDHYCDAGKATHRTFPRADGVIGGGPSPDHNYTTGLLLHYFLTGSSPSKDAVIGLAEWVIAIDDGRRAPLGWLASGPTGVVSRVGGDREHGPGRAAGNSVNALIDAHRLSGNRSYLEKAEELIRRCIHPADDIGARDLLDAERRWYYLVFLQALGKYLDWKADLGELDRMYDYARASLVTYARWMALNERPFLDHPEHLDHPTETWAAQDMRKSEVFKLAARQASASEREAFLERSRFFFDYSVRTLQQMPTSVLTRPMVLLLTNGFMDAYYRRHGVPAAPASATPVSDFGDPEPFVAQRLQALRRAIWIAASAAIATAGWLAWLVYPG